MESAGTALAVMLTIWIARYRPGWRLMAAAIGFALVTVFELRNSNGGVDGPIILGAAAGAVAGLAWQRPRGVAAAVLAMSATLAPELARAMGIGLAGLSTPSPFRVPMLALTGVGGLAVLAFESRTRRSTLKAVEHERDMSRRVWDATTNGIVAVNLHGRIAEWNPAMERLTGLTRREAMGTKLTDCAGFGADGTHANCLRQAAHGIEIATGATGKGHSETMQSRFNGYYSPLRDANGQVTGVLAIISRNTAYDPAGAEVNRIEARVA